LVVVGLVVVVGWDAVGWVVVGGWVTEASGVADAGPAVGAVARDAGVAGPGLRVEVCSGVATD
jgi:hypothetical protein